LERRGRRGLRVSGATVNGGSGPDCELGVELPEDDNGDAAGLLPFAERLADLTIAEKCTELKIVQEQVGREIYGCSEIYGSFIQLQKQYRLEPRSQRSW
jgi:hypothetical protein